MVAMKTTPLIVSFFKQRTKHKYVMRNEQCAIEKITKINVILINLWKM